MFRLLKLVAYGLLGYAIYEFVRGAMGTEIASAWDQMTSAQGGGSSAERGTGQGSGGNLNRGGAARANMTGPGRGQVEETQESDGGSVRHKVGRGVVS